ncbi:MAG: DMT family transporter, partial [Nanoarchaeota archaeon]|nr:DMT family transporter [Nanoarchaeota archaeon]
ILTFISAIFDSTGNVFLKKLTKGIDTYSILLTFMISWTPVMIVLYLLSEPAKVTLLFLILSAAAAFLIIISNIIYIAAMRIGNLSLIMPLMSLTPFFVTIFSFFLNKEIPTPIGLFGIFLIVMGCYVLNIKNAKKGFLEPFKKIWSDKPAKMAVFSTILFAISLTIDKYNINLTNTFFYFSYKWIFTTLIFLIILTRVKINFKGIKENWKPVIASNGIKILAEILGMYAMGLYYVTYVTAVKRSSVLFDVLYGHFVFKEKETKQRLLGALVIVAGLIMIAFFS